MGVLGEELDGVVAAEEADGELAPAQSRAHLDPEPDGRVRGVPCEVATAWRSDHDAARGCVDVDTVDAKRGATLQHLEAFLHRRVNVLGCAAPGRVHVVSITKASGDSETNSTCSPVRAFSIILRL